MLIVMQHQYEDQRTLARSLHHTEESAERAVRVLALEYGHHIIEDKNPAGQPQRIRAQGPDTDSIFIVPMTPVDLAPKDGTARRIARIREVAAEGDPYEHVLTRYAAQVLLGEISRLTEALAAPAATEPKIYLVRQDRGERMDFYPYSAHLTLDGAVTSLNKLAAHYDEPVDSITDEGLPSTTGQTVYIDAMRTKD